MNTYFLFLVSLIVGMLFAYGISRFGFSLGLADIPNPRSSHKKVTPRGGGLGIPVVACIVGKILIPEYDLFWVAFGLLALISLLDDRFDLPVEWRFSIQFMIAFAVALLVGSELIIEATSSRNAFLSIALVFFLAFLYTGAANFFNFMDGINGIAGFEAMISFGFLAFYSYFFLGLKDVSILSMSVTASSAGFLVFNYPKPKVFMGDVGSISAGFLFVALASLVARDVREFLVLLSFQSAFYVDSIATLLIRIRKKENLFQAHMMHLYQRMVHVRGWSHSRVTRLYTFVQIIVGITAIFLRNAPLIWLVVFHLFLFVSYFVVRIKAHLVD